VGTLALLVLAVAPVTVLAAGPPFPDPVTNVAVYDEADVFSPATEADAERTIDAIEARTGVEIVVYSQVVDYGISTSRAEQHAIALMDQWGVGRAGFSGGLGAYFDMDPTLVRVGWVFATLVSGGAAILAYAAMLVVIPRDNETEDRLPGVPA